MSASRTFLSFLALLLVGGLAQSPAASAASLPPPPKVCTSAQDAASQDIPMTSPCLLDYITGEDQPGFPAEWTNPDPTASHVLRLDVSPSQITVGGKLHISLDTGLPVCTTQLESANTPCIVMAEAGRPGFEGYYPAPKQGRDFSAYAIPELIPNPGCLDHDPGIPTAVTLSCEYTERNFDDANRTHPLLPDHWAVFHSNLGVTIGPNGFGGAAVAEVALSTSPGCSATATSFDVVRVGSAPRGVGPLAAAASAACSKLTVSAVPQEKSKSGLSRDDAGDPAFAPDVGSSDKCLSGCTDVLVTVKDPSKHNQPVRDASVSASVTPIFERSLAYPSGHPDGGYLCKAADPRSCGSGRLLRGLKTNGKGQVSLLYWAPGVLHKLATTLTVKATKECTAKQCSSRKKSGEVNRVITVSPNLIYQHGGTLSLEEVDGLIEWADSGGFFELSRGEAIEVALEKAIEKEIKEEKLAERVSKGVTGLLKVGEFAHAVWEQQGFEAFFMNALNLSGAGLGCAADNGTVSANPCADFQKAFANGGAPPLRLFANGLIWQIAQRLAFIQAHPGSGPAPAEMPIHLYVYEVSYCEQGGECLPGYHGRGGIHPFLYFELTAGAPESITFVGAFVVPYNARAWMDTQTF